MYPIIEVSKQDADIVEQLGTKPKFWSRGKDGRSYLFKESRPDVGEHWAEKVACELSELLGIPHAKYELANFQGIKGVICYNFVPVGGDLIHGNELLLARDKKYPNTRFYQVKEHTLDLVMDTIDRTKALPPIGWADNETIRRAADVFVGYLMLDAWIANQDRHHENWGLIWTERTVHLAPSYDHASSLGRNESDERRKHRLINKGRDGRTIIESYVENAYSAFYTYDGSNRLKTMEAFEFAARRNPVAGNFWLSRLGEVAVSDIQTIFGMIPKSEISDLAIEFAQRMLSLNKQMLLTIGAKL
jgi:hypothetical protein